MPFKSRKQERYLQINEPEIYQDWVEEYGHFSAESLCIVCNDKPVDKSHPNSMGVTCNTPKCVHYLHSAESFAADERYPNEEKYWWVKEFRKNDCPEHFDEDDGFEICPTCNGTDEVIQDGTVFCNFCKTYTIGVSLGGYYEDLPCDCHDEWGYDWDSGTVDWMEHEDFLMMFPTEESYNKMLQEHNANPPCCPNSCVTGDGNPDDAYRGCTLKAESFNAESGDKPSCGHAECMDFGMDGWLSDREIVFKYFTQWRNNDNPSFNATYFTDSPIQALNSLSPEDMNDIANEQRESVGCYRENWVAESFGAEVLSIVNPSGRSENDDPRKLYVSIGFRDGEIYRGYVELDSEYEMDEEGYQRKKAESFSAQEYGTNCNTCGGFLRECIGYVDGEPCNQAGSEPRLCTKCEDDIRCSSCSKLYFHYGGADPQEVCDVCHQIIGYDPISNLNYSHKGWCKWDAGMGQTALTCESCWEEPAGWSDELGYIFFEEGHPLSNSDYDTLCLECLKDEDESVYEQLINQPAKESKKEHKESKWWKFWKAESFNAEGDYEPSFDSLEERIEWMEFAVNDKFLHQYEDDYSNVVLDIEEWNENNGNNSKLSNLVKQYKNKTGWMDAESFAADGKTKRKKCKRPYCTKPIIVDFNGYCSQICESKEKPDWMAAESFSAEFAAEASYCSNFNDHQWIPFGSEEMSCDKCDAIVTPETIKLASEDMFAESFSAELKRDSCCCGATKSKPCACMIQGVMECNATCPCSLEKSAESFGAESCDDLCTQCEWCDTCIDGVCENVEEEWGREWADFDHLCRRCHDKHIEELGMIAESFSSEMSHSDKSLILWEMVQQNLNYPPAVEGFYATFFGVDKEYYDGMDLVVLEAVKDLSKNPEWTDEMFKEYRLDNCYGCGDDSKTTKYLPFDEGEYDYWCKECYEDSEGEKWDAESFGADSSETFVFNVADVSGESDDVFTYFIKADNEVEAEEKLHYEVSQDYPDMKFDFMLDGSFGAESFNSYKVAPDLSSYTKAELVSSIAGPQGTAAYQEVVYDPIAQSRMSAETATQRFKDYGNSLAGDSVCPACGSEDWDESFEDEGRGYCGCGHEFSVDSAAANPLLTFYELEALKEQGTLTSDQKEYLEWTITSTLRELDSSSYTKQHIQDELVAHGWTLNRWGNAEPPKESASTLVVNAEGIDSFSPTRLMVLGASIGVALGLYKTRGD